MRLFPQFEGLSYGDETQTEAPKIPAGYVSKYTKAIRKTLHGYKTSKSPMTKYLIAERKMYTVKKNPFKPRVNIKVEEKKHVPSNPKEKPKIAKPVKVHKPIKKPKIVNEKENPEYLKSKEPKSPKVQSKCKFSLPNQ